MKNANKAETSREAKTEAIFSLHLPTRVLTFGMGRLTQQRRQRGSVRQQ